MVVRWIPKEERLPTKDDADVGNCVLVWHYYQGCMTMGVQFVEKNRFVTHWCPCLPRPEYIDSKYKSR